MARELIRLLCVATMSLAGAASAEEPPPTSEGSSACIALVLPSVEGVQGNATDVGVAVREVFTSYLTGPSIRAMALDARLMTQAVAEARQKECLNVLSVTVTHKRGGGGRLGRVVGQAGSWVAWGIPGGSVGSAVARGVVAAASQAVSDLASTTKARDEMRLEYRLQSLESETTLGPTMLRAKASVDGEDLLTPLVEQIAEAIAAAVAPK